MKTVSNVLRKNCNNLKKKWYDMKWNYWKYIVIWKKKKKNHKHWIKFKLRIYYLSPSSKYREFKSQPMKLNLQPIESLDEKKYIYIWKNQFCEIVNEEALAWFAKIAYTKFSFFFLLFYSFIKLDKKSSLPTICIIFSYNIFLIYFSFSHFSTNTTTITPHVQQ